MLWGTILPTNTPCINKKKPNVSSIHQTGTDLTGVPIIYLGIVLDTNHSSVCTFFAMEQYFLQAFPTNTLS